MSPIFIKKLDFWVWKTKVGAQKIDGLIFEIFEIVIAFFSTDDRVERSRFFEKTFLLADISIDIALGILFLTLNNVKINFLERELN